MNTKESDNRGSACNAVVMPRKTLEVVYTWDDGRQEVRYRRPFPSPEAWKLIGEVRTARERAIQGRYESPYSWRII